MSQTIVRFQCSISLFGCITVVVCQWSYSHLSVCNGLNIILWHVIMLICDLSLQISANLRGFVIMILDRDAYAMWVWLFRAQFRIVDSYPSFPFHTVSVYLIEMLNQCRDYMQTWRKRFLNVVITLNWFTLNMNIQLSQY